MKLGAHMSVAGGFEKSIERGLEIGCEAIQIFVKSNRSWKAREFKDEEFETFKKTRKGQDKITSAFVHGTYLVNLAAEDKDVLVKSIECFEVEYDLATKFGLDFLVFHPGAPKSMGLDEGITQIAKNLNKIAKKFSKSPVKILLENTAGQGSTIGKYFGEIKQIIDKLEEPRRFGLCFDTCHAFAAGYDIRTEKTYEKTMKEIDDEIGLENLHAFHVNDSKFELGTNHDRHEHIGDGLIGLEGFRLIVNDARFENHPGTLETPDDTKFADDLRKLRSLLK
nr:deoxyribonuclease IV [Candidatus Sigynarchaeota archaeon]